MSENNSGCEVMRGRPHFEHRSGAVSNIVRQSRHIAGMGLRYRVYIKTSTLELSIKVAVQIYFMNI